MKSYQKVQSLLYLEKQGSLGILWKQPVWNVFDHMHCPKMEK